MYLLSESHISKLYSRRLKSQTTTGRNVCKRQGDKGPVSKVQEELAKLNSKKTNSPIKKRNEDLNGHLAKEDIQMASKQMKTGSMSHVTRETKTKAARSHCVSVSTASIQGTDGNRYWRGCRATGLSLMAVGMQIWVRCCCFL